MYETLEIMGKTIYQLVQDFSHQQYGDVTYQTGGYIKQSTKNVDKNILSPHGFGLGENTKSAEHVFFLAKFTACLGIIKRDPF